MNANLQTEIPRRSVVELHDSHLSSQCGEVLRGKRILITGGTGFIGTALAQRLCPDNEVVLLDQRLANSSFSLNGLVGHSNIRVEVGSVLDPKTVGRLVQGVDIAVHLAAIVGVDKVRANALKTLETNIFGAVTLLKALEKVPNLSRAVFFSSSEVFGVNSFRVHEGAPTSVGSVQEARWSYSVSKLVGEHLVQCYHRESGMPTVTIRPFNIFGPGRIGDHAMLRFIWNAQNNRNLIVHGTGDQIRSWCYVDDLADAVMATLIRPEAIGEDFNIGNARNTLTIYQLAKRIIALTQSQSRIVCREATRTDIDIRVPRLDKSRELLGFEPKVEIDEGILKTAEWCKEHAAEVGAALHASPLEPQAFVSEERVDTVVESA